MLFIYYYIQLIIYCIILCAWNICMCKFMYVLVLFGEQKVTWELWNSISNISHVIKPYYDFF
jgi:hypothetical protein